MTRPWLNRRARNAASASDWCQVQEGDYRGYLKRGQFWGTLHGEMITP